LPAGTACGSASDTACTDPDICDAAGTCLPRNAAAGTACGDQGVACHFNDSCNASGACVDAGLRAPGVLCGNTVDDQRRNPDVCGPDGGCEPNDAAVGTSCTMCPAGTGNCQCRNAACVNECVPFAGAAYGYMGCNATEVTPSCADIATSGVGLSLPGNGSAAVPIGFDFTFYDTSYTTVTIEDNGLLKFAGVTPAAGFQCLPSAALTGGGVAALLPFWADLNPVGGQVYYLTSGRAELSESGQNMRVCYVDTGDAGQLATAGITDAAGVDELQYTCQSATLVDGAVVDYFCTDGCPFTSTTEFDDLSDGQLLAANSSEWDPWNSAPFVTANNDLVRGFEGGASGIMRLSAMSYIPTGTTGSVYFIALDTYYATGTQHWLSQIRLNGTNNTVVDEGGTATQTGGGSTTRTLIRNTWVPVEIVINIAARTYTSRYNGQALMTNRTWTLGGTGGVHGAIDLYGNTDLVGGGYFDDVGIEKQ